MPGTTGRNKNKTSLASHILDKGHKDVTSVKTPLLAHRSKLKTHKETNHHERQQE